MKKYRHQKKKYKKKRKSVFRSKIAGLILVLIIFAGFFSYLFFFSYFFQVKEIQVSGDIEKRERLRQIVADLLNQEIFSINSRSIFLADLKEVKKEVLSAFPELKEISIKRKLPSFIVVEAEERTKAAVWCQEECFDIDEQGVAFEKADKAAGAIVAGVGAPNKISVADKVIDENYLKTLLEIKNSLEQADILVQEILISEQEKIEAVTGQGWKIYFDEKDNVKEAIFNLNLVIKEKIPTEKIKNLEYIDLRFGNKVYFKYR